MGRPRKQPTPAPIEPEEESQEVPEVEPETTPEPETTGKPITKADAIRRALAEGLTKAEDALPFIKSHFGHDVTPGHFAASKSRELPKDEAAQEAPAAPRRGRPPGKANGATGKPGRKPKAASQVIKGYLAPPPAPRSENGESDLLAAMEAMKPLVASLGAEKVKRLADLLG